MAKARRTAASRQQQRKPQPVYRWPVYLAFAIAVAAPLVISRVTYDQFDIAKLAVVRILSMALLLVWLFRPKRPGGEEVSYTRGDFLLLAFLGCVLLSTVLSPSPVTAVIGKYKRYEGLLTFTNYALLYFVGMQIFRTSEDLAKLSKVIAGTAYLVAGYGLLQFMQLDPIGWGTTPFEARKAFATFGNPDLLAGYLALAMPVALGELATANTALAAALGGGRKSSSGGPEVQVVNVAVRFVGFLVILAALLLTFTRGAWLAGLVAFVGLTVVYVLSVARGVLGDRSTIMKVVAGQVAVSVAIVVVIVALAARTGDTSLDVSARVSSIANLTEGSAGTRLEIWKSGLEMMKDRPLFGSGPDTFRLMSERYETRRYVQMTSGTSVADNAHNFLIQIGVGVGLVGLAALIGFLAFWILRSPGQVESGGAGRKVAMSRAGLYWGAIGYLSYLLTGISVVGTSAVFWLLLGAMMGTSVAKRSTRTPLRPVLLAVLAVPMAAVTVVGVANFVGDYYFARGVTYASQGNLDQALADVDQATFLYPGNSRYLTEIGRYMLAASGRAQGALDDPAVDLFKQARQVEPMEVDNYMFLGAAYSARWQRSRAEADIRESNRVLLAGLRLRPHSAAGHYLLGSNYLSQKRYKLALLRFKQVEKLAPGYQRVNKWLAETYKELGDSRRAADYAQKAADQEQAPTGN